MTLKEFIDKYNGKFVEVAGPNSPNQCVDIANKYLQEVLGQEIVAYADASMFPARLAASWNWIPNTPEGIPQPGDLVIWDGIPGHIAIFIDGDATRFNSFDQNYPSGSPAHVQSHTYLRPKVLGWLHPKESMTQVTVDGAKFEELVTKATRLDEILAKYAVADADGLYRMIAGLQSRITDLTNQLGTAQAEMVNREEQVSRLKAQLTDTQAQLSDVSTKLNEKIGDYEDLAIAKGQQYIELQQALTQIDTLKQAQAQGELTLTIRDLFTLIWNQKVTIKK